ncbi:hypothetical protein Tco_0958106, partial [Tanacetum coccineum]
FVNNENTEEKKYVRSLHKIHATSFPEEDLEEKLIRWVRKEFKTFNEEVRLLIQHWKDSWQKRMYKIKHRKQSHVDPRDNDKVNMPSFPSPEPEVSYFNDLDFFKDFGNEFLAIVYNDALTSKLDLLTELTISPRHFDEFDLKDETSLSKCDEDEINKSLC